MIQFKSCKWKNFLSTGNEFTEFQLDKTPTTLIIGPIVAEFKGLLWPFFI